jgi:hypothetical protein
MARVKPKEWPDIVPLNVHISFINYPRSPAIN